MTAWRDLEAELDAWAQYGREATFWWRDDDAVEPTAALDRLLALSADSGVPLAIAAVPGRCAAALAERLAAAAGSATALQHGYAHCNHAPPGEKKAELGGHHPVAAVCEELARGAALMAGLFSSQALPVLVPPWNRIAPELLPLLPDLGLAGLSTYGPRPLASPSPTEGIAQGLLGLTHKLCLGQGLNHPAHQRISPFPLVLHFLRRRQRQPSGLCSPLLLPDLGQG